jgi:hypothetical protein
MGAVLQSVNAVRPWLDGLTGGGLDESSLPLDGKSGQALVGGDGLSGVGGRGGISSVTVRQRVWQRIRIDGGETASMKADDDDGRGGVLNWMYLSRVTWRKWVRAYSGYCH